MTGRDGGTADRVCGGRTSRAKDLRIDSEEAGLR